MEFRYEYGDAVRVIRNIRNDGTYPGATKGKLLVQRGNVGYVRNIGTFLQDQVIYSVDFLSLGCLVGCREQELIPAQAPWGNNNFELHDKVYALQPMSIKKKVVVSADEVGEVLRVLCENPNGVHYHVSFRERILLVPETALGIVNLFRCGADNLKKRHYS